MSNTDNLARAIGKDFKGCSRAELEAFAGQIGVEFHPNIGDEKLRARMMEKLGKEPVEMPGTNEVQQVDGPDAEEAGDHHLSLKELMKLNLTPDGLWEGRRRLVTIVRPDNFKGNAPHPFRWGRALCTIPYNRMVSVPYPIYHIIRNSDYKEVEQERTTGRDGTPRVINHYVTQNRWRYNDLGDDPKTEHLPVSQKDQFQQVAERSGLFAEWDRRQLTRLARRITGIRYPKGAEAGEIRDAILMKLGYDVDMLDDIPETDAA